MRRKLGFARYVGTALILTPLCAGFAGGIGYMLWQVVAMVYVLAATLLGISVEGKLPDTSQEYFVYGSAALGVIGTWWGLWPTENGGASD